MTKPETNINQLETVFNFLVEPVLVFDAGGKLQRVNPAAVEAFGFDSAGISLASLAEELMIRYADERLINIDELPVTKALKGETIVGERFMFTNARGYDHIVEASAIPLIVEGKIVGAVSVWHDITAREAALEDIRESRRQVLDILESVSDGFFALDNLWRFTYVNQRAQQLLQLKKEYVLYATIWDRLPQAVNSGLYINLQKAMEEGKAISFEEFYAPVGKWFEVHAYPYENGLSVYFSDVTQRKRIEEQQERTQQLSNALNNINAAINSTLDFDEIMKRVVVDGAKAIGCETSSIDIREGNRWTIKYLYGLAPELIGTTATDEELPLAMLAAKTRQPTVVNDAYNDPRVNPERIRRFNLRSILVLPLTIKDEVVGALFFNYHSAPASFSDAEIDFASKLASSISLALANAKLYSTAQDELSRTRVLQDVAIAATSIQDLSVVASEVLEALSRHMNIKSGEIRILDEERQVLSRLASFNFPEPDKLKDLELEKVGPLHEVSIDDKRYLVIPVDFRDQILGSLELTFEGRREFAENELQVFHAVAHIIGQAIENSRLFACELGARARDEERVRELEILREITSLAIITPDPNALANKVATRLGENLGLSVLTICLVSKDKTELIPISSFGYPPGVAEALRPVKLDEQHEICRVFISGEPVVVEDTTTAEVGEATRKDLERLKQEVGSYVAMPLKARTETIGTITMGWPKPQKFIHEDIEFFTLIANEVALGIENARLHKACPQC